MKSLMPRISAVLLYLCILTVLACCSSTPTDKQVRAWRSLHARAVYPEAQNFVGHYTHDDVVAALFSYKIPPHVPFERVLPYLAAEPDGYFPESVTSASVILGKHGGVEKYYIKGNRQTRRIAVLYIQAAGGQERARDYLLGRLEDVLRQP